MREIRLELSGKPTRILVGPGLLDLAGPLASEEIEPGKCALVGDDTICGIFGDRVLESLSDAGFHPVMVTFPAGETSKRLGTVESICEAMIDAGLDRRSSVFALGGGVSGDVGGFVGAIYYRGIPVVQIPTTLLAQVDSSIGGKTGVNASSGKNLIGAFHQPVLTLADCDVLESLPPAEFSSGMAEVIKHGVIRDPEMLRALPGFAQEDVAGLVERNMRIKANIVVEDEQETTGERALLNFGHTIGHAIEQATDYSRYLHGEAVSLGIVGALDLSVEKCGFPPEDRDLVLEKLKAARLPVRLDPAISTESIIAAARRDKKFVDGKVRFVLSDRLGSAFLSTGVTEAEIAQAVARLRDSEDLTAPAAG